MRGRGGVKSSFTRRLLHIGQLGFFDEPIIPERLYYISAFRVFEQEGLPALGGQSWSVGSNPCLAGISPAPARPCQPSAPRASPAAWVGRWLFRAPSDAPSPRRACRRLERQLSRSKSRS